MLNMNLNMEAMAAQQMAAMGAMMIPPGFLLQAQQAAAAFSPGMPHLAHASSTLPTLPGMPIQQPRAEQPAPQQVAFMPGQQPPAG